VVVVKLFDSYFHRISIIDFQPSQVPILSLPNLSLQTKTNGKSLRICDSLTVVRWLSNYMCRRPPNFHHCLQTIPSNSDPISHKYRSTNKILWALPSNWDSLPVVNKKEHRSMGKLRRQHQDYQAYEFPSTPPLVNRQSIKRQ
jgi:hypothetical protein